LEDDFGAKRARAILKQGVHSSLHVFTRKQRRRYLINGLVRCTDATVQIGSDDSLPAAKAKVGPLARRSAKARVFTDAGFSH